MWNVCAAGTYSMYFYFVFGHWPLVAWTARYPYLVVIHRTTRTRSSTADVGPEVYTSANESTKLLQ